MGGASIEGVNMGGRKKGACQRSEGAKCMHGEMYSFKDYQCHDKQNFLLLTLSMWADFFLSVIFKKEFSLV